MPLTGPATPTSRKPDFRSYAASSLGYALFATRWLQAPLYFGLVAAQGVYVYKFFNELWHLITAVISGQADETHVMLAVLKLVDVVMIANLLIMVIVGGYETFVSRIGLQGHRDQPEWLSHVNSNVLKVKLATAIVGISSVHLLQMFVDVSHTSQHSLLWGTVIHMAFILSAAILAYMSGPMEAHSRAPDFAAEQETARNERKGYGDRPTLRERGGPDTGGGDPPKGPDDPDDPDDPDSGPSGEHGLPGAKGDHDFADPGFGTPAHDERDGYRLPGGDGTEGVGIPRPRRAAIPAQGSPGSRDGAIRNAVTGPAAAEDRIHAAGFPARKVLEEFDDDHQRALEWKTITRLGTLDFVDGRSNAVFLGPPGTGKTHLAIALGTRACRAGHDVLFATGAEWTARLAAARSAGRLTEEIARLDRYSVLIVDEIGYVPFTPDETHLLFRLVSHRYERASVVVTSDKPFNRWTEIFGDTPVTKALIDRLAHHADVVTLQGDSYRLRGHDLDRTPVFSADPR
ncbi:IS21-like element helper ATPase IstB [Streptomyces uncialis]|uniref:IS21-like element helper ATPase IstB n=1 Tax=Streptomyces uncialis TaxID=1048205 RepID=UPI003810315A